jgi:hypothetical protein
MVTIDYYSYFTPFIEVTNRLHKGYIRLQFPNARVIFYWFLC